MEEVKDLIACPCCGKETFPRHAELNQQILDVFMACILSQKPFTYTYNLFKNKISITCRQPSNKDIENFAKLGRKFNDTQDAELKTLGNDVLFKLTGIWSLVNITIRTKQDQKSYNISEVCNAVYQELANCKEFTKELFDRLLNMMSDPERVSSLSILTINKVLDIHAKNTQLLTIVGFDQDFYNGIPHI